MTSNHLFCFGLGYSATKLADKLLDQGWRVSGTCRSMEKFPELKSMGITPYIFSDDLPLENVWDLDSVTHILHSIPPKDGSDPVFENHIDDIKSIKNLQWLGYLSTTGVYGNHDGGWVDEETPTSPNNDRSKWRVMAENLWLDNIEQTHIFRLSGIYGKGRSSFEALANGTARRIKKENQFFSRIHVDDIVSILEASINQPNNSSIYNCADDFPCPQEEVVAYAAELLGVEPPPLVDFADADLSPMARSFYGSSRKTSNQKIKDELSVNLLYPDYKSGLKAIKDAG